MNSTYEAITESLGEPPSWLKFDLERYEDIFINLLKQDPKRKMYTSSFQIVPPTQWFGRKMPNYAATLRFVKALMEMGMPERLLTCEYATDASAVLQSAPTLGGFLSLNMLVNLNQSPHVSFKYRNFASCGPGSRKYLQAIFGSNVINSVAMEEAGLKWLYDNQWRYWARLGENPPHCKGLRQGMRVLDFENALCWCWRYVAAATKPGAPKSMHTMEAPEVDKEMEATVSMPAWCEEEWEAHHISKTVLKGDPLEEMAKLPPLKRKRGGFIIAKVENSKEGESAVVADETSQFAHAVKDDNDDLEGISDRVHQPMDQFVQKRQAGQEEKLEPDEGEGEEVEEVYEVEKVIDFRRNRYRVRWKGYMPEEDTWETEETVREGAEEASSAVHCRRS